MFFLESALSLFAHVTLIEQAGTEPKFNYVLGLMRAS